ncbi:hypothetical protein ACH4E7_37900 [Kitasatospora sp. NPDC018058]|uniref:hypothetical protein n=1 Tax=Kitasatospora sp. NPDC018058 TaxID=3364025 RepID=UPI0037BED1A3
MESTPRGLHPHDAARETLAADLRWRAPSAFVTIRQRLAEEYLRVLREAPEERVWTVTDELFYLFREGEIVARLRTWSREDEGHASGLDLVATVHLPRRVTAGIHGSWIPDTGLDGNQD